MICIVVCLYFVDVVIMLVGYGIYFVFVCILVVWGVV